MKLALFVIFTGILAISYASLQTATAQGYLVCDGKPVMGATVEMWEKDTLDPDDKFGNYTTGGSGYFSVSMEESEITKIKPYIKVIHKCNAKETTCHRESVYNLPETFAYKKEAKDAKPWDTGRLELMDEAKDGDKRVCKKN